MKKVVGVVLGLLPVSVFAECVPVPNCASIGFTKTSCEGDSLKCPFDTSKLYCVPCDSSYKYSCSGDNIKNPIGDTCNNKYAACECIAGATFTNGECICNTSCDTIGNIYYSDGTCSSCNITDKTPVGIVAYIHNDNHFLLSLEEISMPWSTSQTDENGTEIITWNKDLAQLTNYGNANLAKQDYNGVNNTQIIVETYGENAIGVAAVYCYNYAPEGLESTRGNWYLPATGEVYDIIYINREVINKGLTIIGLNPLANNKHLSSSEYINSNAWNVNLYNGEVNVHNYKWFSYPVRCLLAI